MIKVLDKRFPSPKRTIISLVDTDDRTYLMYNFLKTRHVQNKYIVRDICKQKKWNPIYVSKKNDMHAYSYSP